MTEFDTIMAEFKSKNTVRLEKARAEYEAAKAEAMGDKGTSIEIDYDGANDEGSITEVRVVGAYEPLTSSLKSRIEDYAYGLLGDQFGGWEINEGSSGTITIDLKTRKVKFSHHVNVMTERLEEREQDL